MTDVYEKYRCQTIFKDSRKHAEATGLAEERPVVVVFKPPVMCEDLLDKIFQAAERGEALRVEPDREIVFHRLRLRAATDPESMKNVVVLYDDGSGKRQEISLEEKDELDWPKGFLARGIDMEMEIRDAQRAKGAKGYHELIEKYEKKENPDVRQQSQG